MVAVTGLYVGVFGGDAPTAPVGITVVLDSPEAFATFIENHPAGR